MDVAAQQSVLNFLLQFVGDHTTALNFAKDPYATLGEHGITAEQLANTDMTALVAEACQSGSLSPAEVEALQYYSSTGGGYGGGGGGYSQPAPHPNPAEHVVQQLQYVNYVTHEGDTVIQTSIVDQSTDIDFTVDGNFTNTGTFDFDVDTNNANASGEGAVAVGEAEGDVNAATGDNSQIIDDSHVGQNQNNSAGAVQVGGGNEAPIVTGPNSGIINDNGTVEGNVLGDGNQTANIDGQNNAPLEFGEGDLNNLPGSTVTNSNFGDGDNIAGNDLSDGGAIGTGAGNVTGGGNDTTTTTNTTTNTSTSTSNNTTEANTVNAHDSIVNTEQGPGDQHTQNDNSDEGFHEEPPMLRTELAEEHHEAPAPPQEEDAVE